MGIDISNYAGLGVHVPRNTEWEKQFADQWEAYEALCKLIYTPGSPFDVVWAQNSWGGDDDGWVVYIKSTMLDSNREYMFLRMGRVNVPKEVKEKMEELLSPIVGKVFVEPIAVVTVT